MSDKELKTLISNDLKMKGQLTLYTEGRFDGQIEGSIQSNFPLQISEVAHVRGNVQAESCEVRGVMDGTMLVQKGAHFVSGSQVRGALYADSVEVASGAQVNVNFDVGSKSKPGFKHFLLGIWHRIEYKFRFH